MPLRAKLPGRMQAAYLQLSRNARRDDFFFAVVGNTTKAPRGLHTHFCAIGGGYGGNAPGDPRRKETTHPMDANGLNNPFLRWFVGVTHRGKPRHLRRHSAANPAAKNADFVVDVLVGLQARTLARKKALNFMYCYGVKLTKK